MTLRDLPSVDAVARSLDVALPRPVVVEVARHAVEAARAELAAGRPADAAVLASEAATRLAGLRHRRVINATGVLLHTNLGRAPLHPEAADAALHASTSYGTVEFDLATGERGGRGAYVRKLLETLTGAEAALVVNNNAAALLLTLAALAGAAAVPVSRGELIEIGGSYRLPELMAASGAHLVEVGTTNRTRLSDYRQAADGAALLLKVHPSNYRIVGFTEEVGSDRLVSLGAELGIPVAYDVGSGLIDDGTPWLGGPAAWLAGEPGVRQEVARGIDLVLFSGDKLLGGPQAGIVVGRSDLIGRLAGHPIARAVRTSGATMAALSATLERYLDGTAGTLPIWQMAGRTADELHGRLDGLLRQMPPDLATGHIEQGAALIGAGSVPGLTLPTPILVFPGRGRAWDTLLHAEPAVVARRADGNLVVDLRAVDPSDDTNVAAALAAALEAAGGP